MTNHGFIDPDQPMRDRVDRLELLVVDLIMSALTATVDYLSPEARAILVDLESGDEARRNRALRRLHKHMDADPLDVGEVRE